MSELDDELDWTWQAFDVLRRSHAGPVVSIANFDNNFALNAGSSMQALDYATTVFLDDEEDDETDDPNFQGRRQHVCGSACREYVIDSDGSFTCRLTGRVFGQQVCVGPTNDSLMVNSDYSLVPGAFKRKRRTKADGIHVIADGAALFSAASQVLNTMMYHEGRRKFEDERLARSVKAANKVAVVEVTTRPGKPLLSVLFAAYADMEKTGVTFVKLPEKTSNTSADLDAVAAYMCRLATYVLPSHVRVDPKLPAPHYMFWGFAYLLSTDTLGEKMRIPLLTSYLPEEKMLKSLNVNISRVTVAKRYVIDAFKTFFKTRHSNM